MHGFGKFFGMLSMGVLAIGCQTGTENVETSEPASAVGVVGGPCYGNATCNAELECLDGICSERAVPVLADGVLSGPCYGNATCNAGLQCVEGICAESTEATVAPGSLGGPCDGSAMCNTGLQCAEGVCAEPVAAVVLTGVAGSRCYGNGTCNAGLACVEGVCEVPAAGVVPNNVPEGFVLIEPGRFTMGSPRSERGRELNETQHEVTLTRGFYMQVTEVTQGQWQRVMGNNPSHFVICGSDCPVEQVSWLDAVAYANALSRADGYSECYDANGNVPGGGSIYDCAGYRLPTEAEWEYAARAGSTRAQYGALDEIAWYAGNSGDSTHRVGQLQANAWGLYDMVGNVWEWTHEWFGPLCGSDTDPVGSASGTYRGLRGGAWDFNARGLRSAARFTETPSNSSITIGFRLARTAN
jgi:formylglycine-generating enzyme required for sulfatase activity